MYLHWRTSKGAIIGTCDIWDTDYNTDNWEPGLMTIFVTWQLIVTLDSIRNSCDVFVIRSLSHLRLATLLLGLEMRTGEESKRMMKIGNETLSESYFLSMSFIMYNKSGVANHYVQKRQNSHGGTSCGPREISSSNVQCNPKHCNSRHRVVKSTPLPSTAILNSFMLCGLLQLVQEKLEDDLLGSQRQVGLRITCKAFWPSQDTIGKIGKISSPHKWTGEANR